MEKAELTINDQDYFEMPGLNVLVYHNTFLEGHQGGVEIIQHGERVATGGELRLSPAPGQWQPIPEIGGGFRQHGVSPQTVALPGRKVDRSANEISIPCRYPDKDRDRRSFNPIIYPDLKIDYTIRVRGVGAAFSITVDLDRPIPEEWVGRVGYCLELFPGDLYGRTYYMDGRPGVFPRQANGPTYKNSDGEAEAVPLGEGKTLVVAPESDQFRMTIESENNTLELLDGSLKHTNGWFVVRSVVRAGASKNAIQWKIMPHVIPHWKYQPVIHISQVGYHPKQKKTAYIELDKRETAVRGAMVQKVDPSGEHRTVMDKQPVVWGRYLRYQYATLDFTEITEPGIYIVKYGETATNPFPIDPNVYQRHVWQPTLEYFLPMQMCHMRVNQKYRVWHGVCHMDDALMAPPRIIHFDGYDNLREPPAASAFQPLEHIPGLNAGGWHDAGDDDIRTDTQINTILALAHIYEEFGVDYDETTVDQNHHHVEIHQPDGKPDILQQIEHGARWLLHFYRAFGSLGLGVIVPTLRQYVHLGDPSTQTDNRVVDPSPAQSRAARIEGLWYKKVANRYSAAFDPEENLQEIEEIVPDLDDRLVFTQANPARQIYGAAGLALAARVLPGYDDTLAGECLQAAEALWAANKDRTGEGLGTVYSYGNRGNLASLKVHALAELILTTKKEEYKKELCGLGDDAGNFFGFSGWTLGRVMPLLDNAQFSGKVAAAAKGYQRELAEWVRETPFGCPMAHTEAVGLRQYFLHKGWPGIFSAEPLFAVMNYLLGCRPGKTANSLVSGVGVHSPVVAYGFNRADWSYIPGGTFWNAVNLVRPDLAEDKVWPFLWQEREYITDAACMFMFTVLAADRILNG